MGTFENIKNKLAGRKITALGGNKILVVKKAGNCRVAHVQEAGAVDSDAVKLKQKIVKANAKYIRDLKKK